MKMCIAPANERRWLHYRVRTEYTKAGENTSGLCSRWSSKSHTRNNARQRYFSPSKFLRLTV